MDIDGVFAGRRFFAFQYFQKFPQCNNHISVCSGKNTVAERKMLSLESVGLSKKAGAKALKKERNVMKNNQINVPQAKQAMEQFKMQAAQEVGVNLQNGYNGHLTSREAGSVGGQMVKKMIEAYEQGLQ